MIDDELPPTPSPVTALAPAEAPSVGAPGTPAPRLVGPGVWLIGDTCNVYLIEAGGAGPRTAICIDFGSGLVLDVLATIGIDRITDVLMTHHHRDQGQGLPRAAAHGARIHVPPVEVELFEHVEEMWATRQLDNDYNLRQDRFSLFDSVVVDSTVPEYRIADYGGVAIRTIPTPGHTIGSVTYLLDRNRQRLAFTGDLIYAPGKVWSLASTQWSYTENEGPAMTVLSCYLLADEQPATLLPSHGAPIDDAASALEALAASMQDYVDSRRPYPWDLRGRLSDPFVALTEHLLLNRSSNSCSYVLLSATGEAMLFDYGYDMTTGLPAGSDRASRRPWLASIPALRSRYGVTAITAVVPTHYHDDHVGGVPLLRDVEGTELWVPENIAPILADPWHHDLPCQWYEPIVADRVLRLGESVRWNEYEITVHDQPGHTLFAACYATTVDGVTVLFTGDQQEGLGGRDGRRDKLNYQYRNRFHLDDYVSSAELYRRVAPGLMASGHWAPRWVEEGFVDYLAEEGRYVVDIHRRLLPLDEFDMDPDSVMVRLTPYRSRVQRRGVLTLTATVRNPHGAAAIVRLEPVVPAGWHVSAPVHAAELAPGADGELTFEVRVGDDPCRRQRVGVDVTIGALRLGQHAEAVVDVV